MGSWKSNSLEQINMQFKSIMEGMGIDEEKQHRLAAKLNLSKKIKTIISMQGVEERRTKVREYLGKLENRNSMLNLLSLSCSLESGPRAVYEEFARERGHEILVGCMKRMDREFADAVCDTVYTIMNKYGNEFPPFLRWMLDSLLDGRIRDASTFFRILEWLAKEDKVAELFASVDCSRCICRTYLYRVMEYIMDLEKVEDEINFIVPLLGGSRAVYVKYMLFVSDFDRLETKVGKKDVYLEILGHVKIRGMRKCKTDRMHEILRIADEKGVVDVVCCVAEAVVFGERFGFKGVEAEVERSMRESKEYASLLEKKMESEGKGEEVTKENSKGEGKTGVKTRVMKKIVRKSVAKGPVTNKNYVQVKWTKMGKGESVWKTINAEEMGQRFLAHELDVFETKTEEKKAKMSVCEQRRSMVFSEKKNYAVNIALGRVRMSNRELKTAILDLNEDFDENLIKQLLFYFPTDEEIEQLERVGEVFGRGEEFFKECIDSIDVMKKCLYYLYFTITFRNQNVERPLEMLRRYYRMLLTSSSLRSFLCAVLFAGNYLNRGSFLGDAEGFTMESLPRILEVKGEGVSLIDVIMRKVDGESLVRDLGVVQEVDNINFEVVCGEVEEVKKNYINADGSQCEKIQERMDRESGRYEEICSLYDEVVELHRKCCVYFGEDVNEQFNGRMALLLDRLSSRVLMVDG